jgi:hypothetical protein
MTNFEKSDLSFWHDQKHGDFNPETHIVFSPGESEYHDRVNLPEMKVDSVDQASPKEERSYDAGEKNIKLLITNLSDIELEAFALDNPEQKELLADKIETAKDLIKDVLNNVESYNTAVRKVDFIAKSMKNRELEGAEYRSSMQNADAGRRFAHEALISSIAIANRFLNNNFGNIGQDRIDEFKNNEIGAKRKYLEVKRISLPANGVCSANVNLSDRDSIGRWAYDVFDSLTELRKEIK